MPAHDLVTILMPCKDPHIGYFDEAIRSIFDQTDQHWKLTIINDNSIRKQTNLKLEAIKTIHDERISVIDNETYNISGALNTGMRKTSTPYACVLHCDDLLDKNTIRLLIENIIRYPEIDYFHSARRYIDENNKYLSTVYKPIKSFKAQDFQNGGIVKHLHCWKVQAALQIGGIDENLGAHGADDYDFPWCMAEAGFKFQAIYDCLYYYRDHRNHERLTTHVPLESQINELKKIFIKHKMAHELIHHQIELRKNSYLKQALFINDNDKKIKKSQGFDAKNGWRESYYR
jgi:glycosyltransferase involved in cell wall biosynthesis